VCAECGDGNVFGGLAVMAIPLAPLRAGLAAWKKTHSFVPPAFAGFTIFERWIEKYRFCLDIPAEYPRRVFSL